MMNGTSNIMTLESLSTSQRTGATVIAVFALLSTLALAFIALRAIRLAAMAFLQRDDNTFWPPEILFFRTQLGHYGGCLILSNLFIAFAGLIGFNWASYAGLSQGSVCSAQAALMQIGVWGTCGFTTALGLHTLVSFVFHTRPARWRSLAAATIGWTTALVAGLVPLQKSNVYGPTGPSCGITRSHAKDIFALEALPIILTALVSIVVYSVIFIVLRGKLRMNSMQELRGPNSGRRGGNRFEEYHGFISVIIWTMFWFPLAFVLLLLPYCITRIVMSAGYSVSFASSVFADVCASLLGFVNVCLLYNTFRVISPVYRGRHSDKIVTETVMTFGNDASGESPIVPPNKFFSRSVVWSHENSHQLHNTIQPCSNHSRDSSWASVDSNTGLFGAEKAGVIRPTLSGGDAPLCPATPVEKDTRPGLSTRDQQRSSQLMAVIEVSRKGAKEPTFKSKAPPALNLSRLPDFPNPFSPREVTNKSSILATRLGISAPSAGGPSQTSVTRAAQKLQQRNEIFSLSPTSSYDSDSDYSGETTHVCNVRPLSPIPELNDDEQDIVDTCPPSPRTMRTWSQHTTIASVWSQETGYTLSQPHPMVLELYPQPMANLLAPSLMLGNKADIGGMISRQAPLGLCDGFEAPCRAVIKPPSNRHPSIAFALDDNVV